MLESRAGGRVQPAKDESPDRVRQGDREQQDGQRAREREAVDQRRGHSEQADLRRLCLIPRLGSHSVEIIRTAHARSTAGLAATTAGSRASSHAARMNVDTSPAALVTGRPPDQAGPTTAVWTLKRASLAAPHTT